MNKVDATRLSLAAYGWEMRLVPALGGAIEYLGHDGKAVLREPSRPIRTARDGGCFAMVPYANRVANGRFAHDGRDWLLPPEPDQPHSMHGAGWKAAWHCTAHDKTHAILEYRHAATARWPWPFLAGQVASLGPRGCSIALTVRNLDIAPRPAGLGLHGFFPLDRKTRIRARAKRMWRSDATHIPTVPVAVNAEGGWLADALLCDQPPVNNAFDGWDGVARIAQADHIVTLRVSGADCFQLYRPAGADYFAFEPIDHIPDALNRAAMPMLSPGASATLTLHFECSYIRSGTSR